MSLSKLLRNRLIAVAIVISLILGTIGLIMRLIQKIAAGEGTELYISMAGYQVSHLQALMMFAMIPIFLIVALIWRYIDTRQERDFKNKYNIDDE